MPENEYVFKIKPEMTEFFSEIRRGEAELNKMVKKFASTNIGGAKSLGIATEATGVGVYNAQTKAIDNLGLATQKWAIKMKDANGKAGTLFVTQKTLKDGTQQITSTFKRASTMTEDYGEAMGRLFKRALVTIPVWWLLRNGLMAVGRMLSSGIKFLIEWEYQLAQIAIVGKATKSQLNALSGALLQVAKDFGVSYKDLGEASKLWAQQGRAIEEIIPLMRATAQLSKLTGQTTTQSVEDLTAILKAYNIEAKDSVTIIDGMTNAMLNHAITAQDLASAYKQVASTASALGVSFESLTGYITAIKVVTRDSGSKIGMSLRTMFSRITTSSAKSIQNLAGIPMYLDAVGRSTFAVTPRMRDLDSIINELSLKFNDLGNAQQAQIATLIGGVRRQNQVFALFTNFTEAVQAQQDALFGLGKSSKAISTLTDTAKVGIDKLKNSWLSFVETVANSDVIKNTLTTLTNLISGLDKLLNKNKADYKENLNLLNQQNDEYSRQAKFADGIAQNLEAANQMNEQSKRATLEQNKILDERANIIRKAINEAAQNQGFDIKIGETGGLTGLVKELEQVNQKAKEIKLKATVGQEMVQLRQDVLSTGQEIGSVIDLLNNKKLSVAIFQSTGKDKKELLEISNLFKQISDSARIGEIIPNDEINRAKKYFSMFSSFDKEQQNTLNRLLESYQTKNALLQDESKVKDDLLKKEEALKKYQEEILLEREKQQIIAKAVIADEIEQMKYAGYMNSEILKTQKYRNQQLGIEEDLANKIQRQLELQREKTKEQRLQNRLGSESMKLFEIAQTEGVDVAKQIGEVLAGNIDFSRFIDQGGQAVDVFKKQFEDVFKQQQAQQFFKGEKIAGLPDLKGGFGINILEGEGLRGQAKRFSAEAQNMINRLQQQERDATIGRPSTQNQINAPVDVNVAVNLDPKNLDEMQKNFEQKWASNATSVGSTVRRALETVLIQSLYGKQTRAL